jgi:hypothetical protein
VFTFSYFKFLFRWPFNLAIFWTSDIIFKNHGGGGELKLIDPLTLEVRADLWLEERCSYARMALARLDNGEDAFALLGDEFIHQVRWNPKKGVLYQVSNWSTRYRSRWTGTFPGTGPAIFNNTAYFTDNTFPVALLHGQSYSLFSIPLLLPEESGDNIGFENKQCKSDGSNQNYCYQRPPEMKSTNLTFEVPGFMFWSVTVSPVNGDILVWDTAGKNVQCRRASDLSLKWQLSAWQADCLTVAADKEHVYLSDYSDAPDKWYKWLSVVGPDSRSYPDAIKYFIIANVSDGSIIANLTMSVGGGLRISVLVPGAHNDVLVGTSRGLKRIYV